MSTCSTNIIRVLRMHRKHHFDKLRLYSSSYKKLEPKSQVNLQIMLTTFSVTTLLLMHASSSQAQQPVERQLDSFRKLTTNQQSEALDHILSKSLATAVHTYGKTWEELTSHDAVASMRARIQQETSHWDFALSLNRMLHELFGDSQFRVQTKDSVISDSYRGLDLCLEWEFESSTSVNQIHVPTSSTHAKQNMPSQVSTQYSIIRGIVSSATLRRQSGLHWWTATKANVLSSRRNDSTRKRVLPSGATTIMARSRRLSLVYDPQYYSHH